MPYSCLKPLLVTKFPFDFPNNEVPPYASLVSPTPFNLFTPVWRTDLSPFCIPTLVAAGCAVICRTSLWDGHLIALPRVGLLGVRDSVETFAIRPSAKQILPIDIRG